MRRMTVKVTQECIDAGISRHRGDCAIAIAIREGNDMLGWVAVDRNDIAISDRQDQIRYKWQAPAAVRTFISQFDRDPSSVEPFQFNLDPDAAYLAQPMKRTPAIRRPRAAADTVELGQRYAGDPVETDNAGAAPKREPYNKGKRTSIRNLPQWTGAE